MLCKSKEGERVRFLVSVSVIVLFVSLTPLSLSATTRHGCAPLTPPPVAGSVIVLPTQYGTLLINEVLTLPHSTWNCSESGTYTPVNDAWVELYNPQNQPFDLYSVHSSLDSGTNTNAFYLPFGSAIAAHGYLVVFPRTSGAFLSTEGTILRLIINDVVIDEVNIPRLGADQSYARIPDGSSTWQVTSNPTIDASNAPAQQPTPTPRPSNSSSSGYGSGGKYTGSTSGANGKVHVDGTQPDWRILQLPTSVFSTRVVLPSKGVPSTSSQPDENVGIMHKIVLTLLVIALALTLWWGCRLFTRE